MELKVINFIIFPLGNSRIQVIYTKTKVVIGSIIAFLDDFSSRMEIMSRSLNINRILLLLIRKQTFKELVQLSSRFPSADSSSQLIEQEIYYALLYTIVWHFSYLFGAFHNLSRCFRPNTSRSIHGKISSRTLRNCIYRFHYLRIKVIHDCLKVSLSTNLLRVTLVLASNLYSLGVRRSPFM